MPHWYAENKLIAGGCNCKHRDIYIYIYTCLCLQLQPPSLHINSKCDIESIKFTCSYSLFFTFTFLDSIFMASSAGLNDCCGSNRSLTAKIVFSRATTVVYTLTMWHYVQTAAWPQPDSQPDPQPEPQPDRSSSNINNGDITQTAAVRAAALC